MICQETSQRRGFPFSGYNPPAVLPVKDYGHSGTGPTRKRSVVWYYYELSSAIMYDRQMARFVHNHWKKVDGGVEEKSDHLVGFDAIRKT